jgi:hypothetical protein
VTALLHNLRPWSGVFGGALFWYAAHDLGVYFADATCRHEWLAPAIQLAGLSGALLCCVASARALNKEGHGSRLVAARLGVGAGCLFALVLAYQGLATAIYSGCAR